MGDVGEAFDGWKERAQQKRAANRQSSAAMLAGAGIQFERKNDGAHLVVRCGGVVADFWPGTGLWCIRGTGKQRRGVRGLIAKLRAAQEQGGA